MLVHSQCIEAGNHGQLSILASGRVADGVARGEAKIVEDEEAAAGASQIEGLVEPGDGLELGSSSPVVKGEEAPAVGAVEEVEGGLASVVGEEKVAGGGGLLG